MRLISVITVQLTARFIKGSLIYFVCKNILYLFMHSEKLENIKHLP